MSGELAEFCSLLLAQTGVSSCSKPWDCFDCPLMQQELSNHAPNELMWVCPSCITEVIKIAKSKGIPFHVPGHYTEGQCQYEGCTRPQRTEYGDDDPKFLVDPLLPWANEDLVERPAGYSKLLQLFIGDIRS